MAASREGGVKRTDQYVVKAAPSIFQEVTAEEHRRIIDSRRQDFVVGKNKLGYDDAGREIWDSKESSAELRRQEAELKKHREELKVQKDKIERGKQAEAQAQAQAQGGNATGAKRRLESTSDQLLGLGKRQATEAKPVAVPTPTPMEVEAPKPTLTSPVKQPAQPVFKEKQGNKFAARKNAIKIDAGMVLKKAVTTSEKVELRDWLKEEEAGAKAELGAEQQPAVSPAAPPTGARLQPKLSDDGALWFFFLDAFEDERASPPRIYLFGKVLVGHNYQSCCLVVEGLERAFHMLLNVPDFDPDNPEPAKEMADQAELELRQACPGLKKIRTSLKLRNYAFEKALPQGLLPFLKVVCDPAGPRLRNGATGQTFSHVFGSDTSLLERLLITRRIMGPSWLRLMPGSFVESSSNLSYCPVELRITPKSITAPKNEDQRRQLNEMGCPTASPPLRLFSLSMQTNQKSAQHGHEPVAVACTMHPTFSADASESEKHLKLGMNSWRAVRRLDNRPLPLLPHHQVDHFQTEQALLEALLQKIAEFDPDVIACQNAYGFELDVFASRMSALNLRSWQKLGRLRRSSERMPRVDGRMGAGFWVGGNLTAGRLVCDLGLQAKDLLPKLGSYDLPTLARSQLGLDGLKEIEPENLPQCFETGEKLVALAEDTWNNAVCIARLTHSLQLLPLSKSLTNIAGNTWNASLQNKRAERNELLLCHEFHKSKFLTPDKEGMLAKKQRMQKAGGMLDQAEENEEGPATGGPRRQKAAYSGGLVLEPKVGLYDDYVMLLDFNSLYPSIIQEHNICFTTVDRPDEDGVAKCSTETELLKQTILPDGTIEDGILPQVLRRLVNSRQQVKAAMKSERDPKRLQILEIRQLALKLTANSMYGCLGFSNSRFYAKPLAALITMKGREALQTTITVVEQELTLEVVYGDTDSVFVNTKTADFNDAMNIAQQIKRSVNKRYKKLEIEIDGVFGRLLLLKKKKYAGLKVVDQAKGSYEREYKGLDIVRRDWCGLAKGMGFAILDQVLTGDGKEEAVNWIHSYLTEQGKEMDEGKVPLEKYTITKGLTKAPADYPDAKNLPHVQVALRLIARGKSIRAGQELEYVICEASGNSEGPKESFAARARHVSEFELDPTLKVDVAWYKTQQVHPLVSRLLGPVEGTDAARIAECFGLDGARFAQSAAAKSGSGGDYGADYAAAAAADVDALMNRESRFKALTSSLPGVKCKACGAEVSWKQMLQPEVGTANTATGTNALFRCGNCGAEVKPAQAQNVLMMQVRALLRSHCEGWVQCVEEAGLAKTRRHQSGQNLMSERQVLQELEFLEHLCEAATKGYAGEDLRGCRQAATGMRKNTQWLLDVDGYNWVDTGKLFAGLCQPPAPHSGLVPLMQY
jgi:DNA polymerase alpha subunit A